MKRCRGSSGKESTEDELETLRAANKRQLRKIAYLEDELEELHVKLMKAERRIRELVAKSTVDAANALVDFNDVDCTVKDTQSGSRDSSPGRDSQGSGLSKSRRILHHTGSGKGGIRKGIILRDEKKRKKKVKVKKMAAAGEDDNDEEPVDNSSKSEPLQPRAGPSTALQCNEEAKPGVSEQGRIATSSCSAQQAKHTDAALADVGEGLSKGSHHSLGSNEQRRCILGSYMPKDVPRSSVADTHAQTVIGPMHWERDKAEKGGQVQAGAGPPAERKCLPGAEDGVHLGFVPWAPCRVNPSDADCRKTREKERRMGSEGLSTACQKQTEGMISCDAVRDGQVLAAQGGADVDKVWMMKCLGGNGVNAPNSHFRKEVAPLTAAGDSSEGSLDGAMEVDTGQAERDTKGKRMEGREMIATAHNSSKFNCISSAGAACGQESAGAVRMDDAKRESAVDWAGQWRRDVNERATVSRDVAMCTRLGSHCGNRDFTAQGPTGPSPNASVFLGRGLGAGSGFLKGDFNTVDGSTREREMALAREQCFEFGVGRGRLHGVVGCEKAAVGLQEHMGQPNLLTLALTDVTVPSGCGGSTRPSDGRGRSSPSHADQGLCPRKQPLLSELQWANLKALSTGEYEKKKGRPHVVKGAVHYGAFLEECIAWAPGVWLSASVLLGAYQQWTHAHAAAEDMTIKNLQQQAMVLGPLGLDLKKKHFHCGSRLRTVGMNYCGITLLPSASVGTPLGCARPATVEASEVRPSTRAPSQRETASGCGANMNVHCGGTAAASPLKQGMFDTPSSVAASAQHPNMSLWGHRPLEGDNRRADGRLECLALCSDDNESAGLLIHSAGKGGASMDAGEKGCPWRWSLAKKEESPNEGQCSFGKQSKSRSHSSSAESGKRGWLARGGEREAVRTQWLMDRVAKSSMPSHCQGLEVQARVDSGGTPEDWQLQEQLREQLRIVGGSRGGSLFPDQCPEQLALMFKPTGAPSPWTGLQLGHVELAPTSTGRGGGCRDVVAQADQEARGARSGRCKQRGRCSGGHSGSDSPCGSKSGGGLKSMFALSGRWAQPPPPSAENVDFRPPSASGGQGRGCCAKLQGGMPGLGMGPRYGAVEQQEAGVQRSSPSNEQAGLLFPVETNGCKSRPLVAEGRDPPCALMKGARLLACMAKRTAAAVTGMVGQTSSPAESEVSRVGASLRTRSPQPLPEPTPTAQKLPVLLQDWSRMESSGTAAAQQVEAGHVCKEQGGGETRRREEALKELLCRDAEGANDVSVECKEEGLR